jgi:hypothetical protein
MPIRSRSSWTLGVFLCSFGIAVAQEAIENWPAPASWSAPARVISKGEVSPSDVEAVEAVPTPPLHFVGITPCRLVDTRGNGFTGAYGPPVLTQGVPRNFVLTGRCGISATAQAVSLNVTVTNTQGPGFILIYPQGSAQPTVSTLNYVAGQTVANAAVVPLGTGGAITVIAGVSGADLILDTNGDYRGGVVTALNGLSGNVTLASETNVTITPFGQTLFLSVIPDPGGPLPSGTMNQTLRHSGKSWEASSLLTNSGTGLLVAGPLNFLSNVSMGSGGLTFLHNPGTNNTLLGKSTGTTGSANTGVGAFALGSSSGTNNVSVGVSALGSLTSGSGNIGIGVNSGFNLLTGNNNIYIGNSGLNESGQIRIGDASLQNGVVIAGIAGGVITGTPVLVNAGGRLGVAASSRAYKTDVTEIGEEADDLMRLRPVAFRYKPTVDPDGRRQYGLIAEEVAQIDPELVVNDGGGRPFTVRYELVNALLLKEVQNQRGKLESQAATIARQQAEIDELRSEFAKIQAEMSGN